MGVGRDAALGPPAPVHWKIPPHVDPHPQTCPPNVPAASPYRGKSNHGIRVAVSRDVDMKRKVDASSGIQSLPHPAAATTQQGKKERKKERREKKVVAPGCVAGRCAELFGWGPAAHHSPSTHQSARGDSARSRKGERQASVFVAPRKARRGCRVVPSTPPHSTMKGLTPPGLCCGFQESGKVLNEEAGQKKRIRKKDRSGMDSKSKDQDWKVSWLRACALEIALVKEASRMRSFRIH
ncbi:uncharacterized protein LOC144332737 isoform X2 [Macaca mulatta]